MQAASSELTTATVVVSHGGLGSTGSWSVTIDGQTLCGGGAESCAAETALWHVPVAGGIVGIAGCGSILVPHRAAGRVASLTLAELAMVYGGDVVALEVREGADPLVFPEVE